MSSRGLGHHGGVAPWDLGHHGGVAPCGHEKIHGEVDLEEWGEERRGEGKERGRMAMGMHTYVLSTAQLPGCIGGKRIMKPGGGWGGGK